MKSLPIKEEINKFDTMFKVMTNNYIMENLETKFKMVCFLKFKDFIEINYPGTVGKKSKNYNHPFISIYFVLKNF